MRDGKPGPGYAEIGKLIPSCKYPLRGRSPLDTDCTNMAFNSHGSAQRPSLAVTKRNGQWLAQPTATSLGRP